MELVRIVEHQASLSSYRATLNEDLAVQLELLIESTKPTNRYTEWHPLIATPFRYTPPHPQARFRPEYGKNVFYGATTEETSLYEHAFHFMKERIHLAINPSTGSRTLFFVEANTKTAIDVRDDKDFLSIVNRHDYSASHQFVSQNKEATVILYPSCRDPEQRNNAAVLSIHHLEKNPRWETSIKFFYDNTQQQINWLDYSLPIRWQQVC